MDRRLIENVKIRIDKKISMIEKLLDDAGRNNIEHIKELGERSEHILKNTQNLNVEILKTFFEIEKFEIYALTNLCHELSIVALYRLLETELKYFISFLEGEEVQEFDFNKFKDVCNRYSIIISEIGNFYEMNELRLVNNCIKHRNSKVSSELAGFNSEKWIENEDILNCYELFKELSPFVGPFSISLYEYI